MSPIAITNLENSLKIANKLNTSELHLWIFNSLANVHISQALVKYRRADSATQM